MAAPRAYGGESTACQLVCSSPLTVVNPMRHSLLIRGGLPHDASQLAVLATQVWLHTYATNGISREIADYVLAELSPQRYVALLADQTIQVFVAEKNACLVGFAVVQRGAKCPSGAESAVELQTLYVQESFTGQGVGTALLRVAEAHARDQSGTALWLTVNAQNIRAVAFYRQQAYALSGTTYFVLGESRHENHVFIGREEQP